MEPPAGRAQENRRRENKNYRRTKTHVGKRIKMYKLLKTVKIREDRLRK